MRADIFYGDSLQQSVFLEMAKYSCTLGENGQGTDINCSKFLGDSDVGDIVMLVTL